MPAVPDQQSWQVGKRDFCYNMPVSLILGTVLLIAIFGAVAYLASSNMEPLRKTAIIKTIYFYLVSLIALLMVVFSTADLINLGLKIWVFPKTSQNYYGMPCASQIYIPPEKGLAQATTSADYTKQCEVDRKNQEEMAVVQNQRDAVRDISMIVVGIPLFLYHWITLRKDKESEKV